VAPEKFVPVVSFRGEIMTKRRRIVRVNRKESNFQKADLDELEIYAEWLNVPADDPGFWDRHPVTPAGKVRAYLIVELPSA
jgi:alpha-N-acetylglucosamine transferase